MRPLQGNPPQQSTKTVIRRIQSTNWTFHMPQNHACDLSRAVHTLRRNCFQLFHCFFDKSPLTKPYETEGTIINLKSVEPHSSVLLHGCTKTTVASSGWMLDSRALARGPGENAIPLIIRESTLASCRWTLHSNRRSPKLGG